MGEGKGQAIFEFVVATVLFIGIVFYIISVLNSTMSTYMGSNYVNHLNEEAQRVSEILVRSPGVWDGGTPKSPGIALEWPVMDDSKIKYLD